MKILSNSLLIFAGICAAVACSKSDEDYEYLAFNSVSRLEPYVISFEADFVGVYTSVNNDAICGSDPMQCNVIDGVGTIAGLGQSSIHLELSCNKNDGCYCCKYAYLVTEAGDSLYVRFSGKIIQGKDGEHPSCIISYWRDPFIITGGSGRFNGASGKGITDDFSNSDKYTHHHWKGNIMVNNKWSDNNSHNLNPPY